MLPACEHHPGRGQGSSRLHPRPFTCTPTPTKDLRPGQEVSLRYSPVPLSNHDLLRGYGFVLEGNPHDRLALQPAPAGSLGSTGGGGSSSDEGSNDGGGGGDNDGSSGSSSSSRGPAKGLHLSAPHLLAALGLPASLLDPGSGGLDLEAACLAGSSTAAERRLAAVLGSLHPHLTAPSSSSIASSSTGSSGSSGGATDDSAASAPPPPLLEHERLRERAAAKALAAQCQEQLLAMPTSLQQDEALLRGVGGAGGGGGGGWQAAPPLSPRVRAAVAFRAERKRLLRAAVEALERYRCWLDSRRAAASSESCTEAR